MVEKEVLELIDDTSFEDIISLGEKYTVLKTTYFEEEDITYVTVMADDGIEVTLNKERFAK